MKLIFVQRSRKILPIIRRKNNCVIRDPEVMDMKKQVDRICSNSYCRCVPYIFRIVKKVTAMMMRKMGDINKTQKDFLT